MDVGWAGTFLASDVCNVMWKEMDCDETIVAQSKAPRAKAHIGIGI